jgi:deoxyribodipyrimidine photolyase
MQAINIVWFKRDLRFTDHEPLYFARQSNLPMLLVYIFEPSVMAYPDSAIRHWRFVYESLVEMKEKLKSQKHWKKRWEAQMTTPPKLVAEENWNVVHLDHQIYNPVKNSEDHDPEGLFIKQWVPELTDIPFNLIHEPHKLSIMEQQLYHCEIGKHSPLPIVKIAATRKVTSDMVRGFRKNEGVQTEGKRILAQHVNHPESREKNKN